MINAFFTNFGVSLKYLFLAIFKPVSTFNKLAVDDRNVIYAWYIYFFSAFLFGLILVPAALFLRPTGWVPLFFKGIPEDMIYVYFLMTAPIAPFVLNLIVFAVVEITGMIVPNKKQLDFNATFAVMMYALTIVVLLDFITEAVPIIYFFVTGAEETPALFVNVLHNMIFNERYSGAFTKPLLLFMFGMYAVMFIWMIILFINGITAVKKTGRIPSIISGIVATLLYWVVMTIWIF